MQNRMRSLFFRPVHILVMRELSVLRVGLGSIFSIPICFCFFLGSLLGFTQDSKSTVEILETEAAEHRIGDRGPIYTNLGNEHFTAKCEVTVGTDGKAVSARMSAGFLGDLTPLCKTWQYKPFERNGQPVAAKVRESVTILPIGERLENTRPFSRDS